MLAKAFCIVALWLTGTEPAAALDKNVTIIEVQRGSEVCLVAKLGNCSEATITVTGALRNMTSSRPLPVTLDVSGQTIQLLTTFSPRNTDEPWTYTWACYWKHGHRLLRDPASYSYSLPFKASSFQVIQGPNGPFSHYAGSQDEDAIDWAMPAGTTVLAARPGTVVALRSDCSIGAPDASLISEYNYVTIKHADGTYAEYLHLEKDGVLVHLGDKVALLAPIGLSGNTGYTTAPQLHFAVFYPIDGSLRRTLQVRFNAPSTSSQ